MSETVKPGDVWEQNVHVSGRRVRVVEGADPDIAGARVLVEPEGGFGRRSRILASTFVRRWTRIEAFH